MRSPATYSRGGRSCLVISAGNGCMNFNHLKVNTMTMIELKEDFQLERYLHIDPNYSQEQENYFFELKCCENKYSKHILLSKVNVTVHIDTPIQINVEERIIQRLEKEKAEIRCKAQLEVKRIDEQIQQLLALENKK
jgi:hypothetical protein